jgi:hypothetical protein
MSMEKSGSESIRFYRLDIERLKERAKAARSEFLRKNSASILRGLACAALVCGFAAMIVPAEKGPAAVATSSAETVLPVSKALSEQTDNDWMKEVTALVIAPDGTWGTATEPFAGPALGKAIASCKSKYGKEIGCGYQSTFIREGWSIAFRCGGHNFLAAAKTLHAAEQAAVKSELNLRRDYRPDMPPCVRVVSVGPDGRVIDRQVVDLVQVVGEGAVDATSGSGIRRRLPAR